MENVLEVVNLTKNYKKFQLKQVHFSIEPGTICGFIGINGAGKSTTIKLIAGLIKKDAGSISFFGDEKRKKDLNERIGYVPDNCYFYDMQSLKKMKNFISSLYHDWDEEEYQKYLEIFQLDEKKKIGELSKGMKMQFSLALALSHHAELLIMDEPTSGLDPYIRNQTIQILKEFVSNGKNSVLFSTHIVSDLEKAADKIVLIHNGRIVFEKRMEEIPVMQKEQSGREWVTLEDCILNYIERLKREKSL